MAKDNDYLWIGIDSDLGVGGGLTKFRPGTGEVNFCLD